MIELKNVSKGYFGHTKVLESVSLTLGKGEFLYVIGGSGAGKSTFLRMLSTEERPTTGVVSLFGYDLARVSPNTLRAIRQSIGVIPQDIRLIPDLTVFENIALSVTLAGARALRADVKNRIAELLGVLGLAPKKDTLTRGISGGEAQRVAVARALVRSPEIIIADEPTGAQDKDNTWGLMELFARENRQGCAVVLATHDMEIVQRFRKPCAVLKRGTLALEEQLCSW